MASNVTESVKYIFAEGEVLRKALTIRRTEEILLHLCRRGDIRGTIHTAIGQELPALAVVGALGSEDWVFSNHRGHAHFVALTDDVEGLVAEVLGRRTGVCGGLGGSQHLQASRFLSNGIVGGLAPAGVGRALAARLAGSTAISALFIGEGALGEGVVYEALNIAARWRLPFLVVVENNGYAQSTPITEVLAGTIKSRADAFDIWYRQTDSWNLPELFTTATDAVATCRSGRPALLEICTYRLSAHSKNDDYRDKDEIQKYRERDVLSHLLEEHRQEVIEVDRAAIARVEEAVKRALKADYSTLTVKGSASEPVDWVEVPGQAEVIADSIYRFLSDSLEKDSRVILLGEDIGAPYGGAFHVTRDLSHRYPNRVRNTPISEAGIVGVGCGLALAGNLPIVEIMFGDFLPLAFDQILNHAAKFSFVSEGRVQVPMIVRTPMGGRRGYGPTHSQSLEKHFLGIDGLRIVALNSILTPYALYSEILRNLDRPYIVIENKSLYPCRTGPAPIPGFEWKISRDPFPVVRLSPASGKASVTLVCYGQMFDEVTRALQYAFEEEEIVCEAYCLSLISPLHVGALLEGVARTRTIICVEEAGTEAGFGSEVVAQLMERGAPLNKVKRLGAAGTIPAGPLEAKVLPDARAICEAIKEICAS